ncbi:MAG: hypothetical protein RIR12_1177 [Bacteroidota bacterium]|jgi:hypothetical protein
MKRIVFILALAVSLNAFSQSTVKMKDTTFTFTANNHYEGIMQSDYSVDKYTAEIQGDKLVVVFENDESAGSLKGFVFLIKTLSKEKFNETGHVGRTGSGLILKGKAMTYTRSGSSGSYADEEFTLAFGTEEKKKAFAEKLSKVK